MSDPTPPRRRIGPYEQSLIESRARREALEAERAERAERAARLRSRIVVGVVVLLLLAAGIVGGLVWRSARLAAPGTGAAQLPLVPAASLHRPRHADGASAVGPEPQERRPGVGQRPA
ncbi:hypothetical protein [Terrabacter sp. BE26]|uniref:hypothetical protein n=1 Tax=Terrabacter sp. BE26 TaxID=2898152 RepID=UPI0035BE4E38